MDRKLILTNYLNTINLGNNALGVKVAARRYFNKDISDLTLSECAVIAGITQNPSRLNPISGQEANAEKRKVILQYMFEQGYITKAQQEEALADDVYARIQMVDNVSKGELHSVQLFYRRADPAGKGYADGKTGLHRDAGPQPVLQRRTSDLHHPGSAIQAIVDEEVNDPSNYSAARYSHGIPSLRNPCGWLHRTFLGKELQNPGTRPP